ncbi:esterase/lipase [Cladophialophora psammophila CBS 110553]|uniref:Carboxylic ester hydrolase n=1 Tax=Cladophialophora psammophila CBS 110553 TaxID=1182543 RepID=W9WI94_9EURO|nr:esterase/lipase [Cladophialophora psammophila CBS 110553]EXJ67648.1 esterase/lipase [Cladophialophora psammophila CBS 110553]
MASLLRVLAPLAVLLGHTLAHPQDAVRRANVAVSNTGSSLTYVFQNNLNASDDANHVGAILLDPMSASAGSAACQALSETLLTQATIQNYSSDFSSALSYLAYSGRVSPNQVYHIADGSLQVSPQAQLSFPAVQQGNTALPVLCTQSSNVSQPSNSTVSASNQIIVAVAGNTYVGYRNQKSFRFLGLRYADPPQRWVYSHLYTGTGKTVNATAYGAQCSQPSVNGTSEDCLFLNIQTPYIPKSGSSKNLRPVLFWIHGGGFTGGTGADPLSDGGNLASREDIVVVTINYRLSTLGFLAIPGTNIKGNFGIGDQIVALNWTVQNIAKFGGDPTKITIMGESAGAGSVRTLLGSPPAIGLFQGAVAMSNLGGGVTLGLDSNYGTPYSSYYTVNESYTVAGPQIFNASNCTQQTLSGKIACLKKVNATALVNLGTVARYVVQDGTIVNSSELNVVKKNAGSAYVPIMFGNAANDGASFSTISPTLVHNETQGLMAGLRINASYAQAIIRSGLFPYYSTGNMTFDSFNVSQRVATDTTFRCIDQATVYAGAETGAFPAAYYYQFERTINGYNPENVSGAPVTPDYPHGNPNLPYFKLHGADMDWAFGNFYVPLRDANDLYSVQLVSAYFAEFVRSGQPNPPIPYLQARGYTKTLQGVQASGPWEKVSNATGPIKHLDYPAASGVFVDLPQCAWLNYSISYYLEQ